MLSKTSLRAIVLYALLLTIHSIFAHCEIHAETNPRVLLTWDANTEPDLSHYNVYRSHQSGQDFAQINNHPVRENQYVDSSVDSGVIYYYRATAVDMAGNESDFSEEVSVTPRTDPSNNLPVADTGGSLHAYIGQEVMIDGSKSRDSDGYVAEYLWVQSNDIEVLIADDTSSVTTFVAPSVTEPTTFTFGLYVWDNIGERCEYMDVLEVLVQTEKPVACAGRDQNVASGQDVLLDGCNSGDSDGTISNYLWSQTAGPSVELFSDSAMITSFSAPFSDAPTTLTFELHVWDNEANLCERPDTVDIYVTNVLPVAVARTNTRAVVGNDIVLDASGSYDPNGEVVAYLWLQASGPVVKLTDDNGKHPSFTMPDLERDQSISFLLYVWDNDNNQCAEPAVLKIEESAETNSAPVADAGDDEIGFRAQFVYLDGTGTSDPDGDSLTYEWTQTAGIPVEIATPNSSIGGFTTPWVTKREIFEFQLTVSDGEYTVSDTVNVVVLPRRPITNDDE